MAEMLRAAAEEMTEAADDYEGCRPGLGERFLAQLARTALRIDRFSAAGTLWATRGIEVGRSW